MENPNIRFYINIRRMLGIKADDVYQELKAAIPDQHPSRKTVFKWFAHFRDGREHLNISRLIVANFDRTFYNLVLHLFFLFYYLI